MMKKINTLQEYINDESRVSTEEKLQIDFETALIGRLIEAREKKGYSQRELAAMSGVRQPAIARLESRKATPQIDTLIRLLLPLGYTLAIVPIDAAK